MLVPWTFRPAPWSTTYPWSMYSRCPQVGVPSLLQPPATPKFALSSLVARWRLMNPPPVRKSQSAFAAPLASARASAAMPGARRVQIARMIIPPSLNGRGSGPEDHVCDTVDDQMQGIHDDAARGGRLLFDHEPASQNGDRLVRSAAHVDGHAVEREIAENRAAGCAARSRLGLSQYCIGADAGRADAKDQVAERSLRSDPVGQADRGRVKRFRAEQRRDAARELRSFPRVGETGERSGARKGRDRSETGSGLHRACDPVDRLRRAAASYRQGRGRQGQAPELRRAGYGPRQQAGYEHGGTGGGAQERVRVTHLSSLVWDEPRHQRRCGLHPARRRIVHSDYAPLHSDYPPPLEGAGSPNRPAQGLARLPKSAPERR